MCWCKKLSDFGGILCSFVLCFLRMLDKYVTFLSYYEQHDQKTIDTCSDISPSFMNISFGAELGFLRKRRCGRGMVGGGEVRKTPQRPGSAAVSCSNFSFLWWSIMIVAYIELLIEASRVSYRIRSSTFGG